MRYIILLLNYICLKQYIIFILISGIYLSCRHTQPLNIDNLLKEANTLLIENKLRDAENIYENILDENKYYLPALRNLAKLNYSRNKLKEARKYLERAIRIDSLDIELHYIYAIINRDIGRFGLSRYEINPFFEEESYNNSVRQFKWVLNKDSLYKDVLYQYSLLLKFKGKYIEALEVNLKQIQLKPDITAHYCGLLRTFRTSFNNLDQSALTSFLQSDGYDLKNILLGELERRNENYDYAEKIFGQIVANKINYPKSILYSSLLRIYAEKYDNKKFDALYWSVISQIKNRVDAGILFNDLKYIASPEELSRFDTITNYEEYKKYFILFWNNHNPTPLNSMNKRIYEHYKRLLYAEKNYEYERERYYFESKLDSYSLNLEFTDQGLIYIRHGKPDKIIKYSKTFNDDTNSDLFVDQKQDQPSDMSLYYETMLNKTYNYPSLLYESPNESWLYYETLDSPKMIFNFSGPGRFLAPVILNKAIAAELMFWEDTYFRYYASKTLPETFYYQDRLIEYGIKNLQNGLTLEHGSWKRNIINFELPNTVYTFRGMNKKTNLLIVYLIQISDIFNQLPDSIKSIKIETGFGIFDKNWSSQSSKTDTILLKRPIRENDGILKFLKYDIDPDSCGISMFFHPLETEIYGVIKKSIRVRDYTKYGLNMSDVVIASKIEKSMGDNILNRNNLMIAPVVSNRHPLNKLLNVYFEIYNLKKNDDGKTIFSIEYTIKYIQEDKNLIQTIFGKDKTNSISTEYNKFGKDELSPEYISIDVNKLVPGKYNLEITVKDINGRKTEKRVKELEFYELDKK